MIIKSPNFENNERIPIWSLNKQIGGKNIMPTLIWQKVNNAQSYALLCIVYGYQENNFYINCLLSSIPKNICELTNISNINTKHLQYKDTHIQQGKNSENTYGYIGPLLCQNEFDFAIEKKYSLNFIIYALDNIIDVENYEDFEKQIQGHILNIGVLTGYF